MGAHRGARVACGARSCPALLPPMAERMTRPLVRFGAWLAGDATRPPSVRGALLSGVAIGFLWAPRAGPILGLVLTGAAIGGASAGTALLLLSFAAGAATSLALAMIAGGRILNVVKRRLGAEAWMKRAIGATVLAGVFVLAMGWDTEILAKATLVNTAAAEQKLVDPRPDRGAGKAARAEPPGESLDVFVAEENSLALVDEGQMPGFEGATAWLAPRR